MGNNPWSKTDYKEIYDDHHIDLIQIKKSLHIINPKAMFMWGRSQIRLSGDYIYMLWQTTTWINMTLANWTFAYLKKVHISATYINRFWQNTLNCWRIKNILNCANVFKDFKMWNRSKSLRGWNVNSVLPLILMYIFHIIVNLLGAVFQINF